MKTATVRDLRNHYISLLRWIAAGEEVLITQKGVAVARLLPTGQLADTPVDWAETPEVKRDRRHQTLLAGSDSMALIAEAGGQW